MPCWENDTKQFGGGRDDKATLCDAHGENLVKATLPGSGRTYHHDEINQQIHMIIRQSGMTSELEIEHCFTKKLQGMVVSTDISVPILINHLKGYVPNGRQWRIACITFQEGIDQFTKVKVIHNGTFQ